MYQIGDKVMTWWQWKEISGTVNEIPHAHCYKVRIWTGEIIYRLESDLEKGRTDETDMDRQDAGVVTGSRHTDQ